MKLSSLKKSLYSILGGALCIVLFASCENFLKGGQIAKDIEEAIAYNNAKEITVLIQSEEGTGSTVPAGNHKAKQGYDFEVSFTENPAWCFTKWIAVTNDNSRSAVSDGVFFEDASSPKTNVIIKNDSVSIRLIPLCEERIAVSGEPSPRYDTLGVSRDRSISVSFTKELAATSFIFAEEEIPDDAQKTTDDDGNIWAYTLNGQTFLKNISITNIDDYSIAQHFTKPQVDGKLLTIAVDKTNPIEFNAGEIFKTVKVTLSGNITDSSSIKMNASKSWNYQITEATDEKATVTLTSTAAEGSVYLAGTKDYSIGQKITLAFTEDADYQFVKWDYDADIIYIEDPRNINTTAIVREKTTEENPTQIKVICAPRLRVLSFEPVNDSVNASVSKNSSIVITFNQSLPASDDDLAQLENITIAVGGSPVKSSFNEPVISDKTITFTADKSNMLDVPEGQIKTVSVSIPDDFYYKLADGTKIYYGGKGVTYDYKIDASTTQKASIKFEVTANAGTISPAEGNSKYSIGQEIPLNFTAADGWQFNGWIIKVGDIEVPDSKIKITDKSSPATKMIVYEDLQGVIVKADASQILDITSTSPSSEVNSKNSAITIMFNKELASSCENILNQIKITMDGVSVDSYFASRKLSANKITITNTKYLNVTGSETKTITVTVPSSLYYVDTANNIKVYLPQEKSFSYNVNSTTSEKTSISYEVSTPNSGTINQGTSKDYDIGTVANLAFNLAEDYQFNCWEMTDENGAVVDESVIKIENKKSLSTTMTINKYVEGISVKANASQKLKVTSYTPAASSNPKDSSITITFNKNLSFGSEEEKTSLLNSIRVTVDGNSVDNNFATRTVNANTIMLTNTKYLSVADGLQKTVTVTVPTALYYKDSSIKVNLTQEQSFNYVVTSASTAQATINFTSSENTGTITPAAGTVSYSLDKEIPISFVKADGCKFTGWTVTDSNGNAVPASKIKIEDASKESTKLYIYESVSNVTVKANAYLEPTVVSTSPDYTVEGVDCDTDIVIIFNKPVTNTNSVNLASNGVIQIVDASNENLHYETHFKTPVWSNGNKTVKISPERTIRTLLANKDDLKNLRVRINYSAINDSENHAFNASGDSYWTYRINYNMETTAPAVTFTLKKPCYQLVKYVTGDGTYDYRSEESGSYAELSNAVFDKTNGFSDNSNYPKNHVGTRIYFSATASDSGSGYKGLTIKETRIKTVTGDTVSQEYTPVNYDSTKTTFSNEEYVLQSTEDGVIQLDFIFEDYADNKTTKTYYVIRDTKMDSSTALKRYFAGYGTTTVLPDGTTTSSYTSYDCYYKISDQNAVMSFFDTEGSMTEKFNFVYCEDKYYSQGNSNYNSGYSQQSKIFYRVDYGYSMDDMLKQGTGETEIINNIQVSFSIPRDTAKDFFVRITAMDDAGNIKNIIRVIPGKVNLSIMTQSGNNAYFHLDNIHAFDNNVTEYGASRFDYTYVYTYQATEDAEPTEFRTKSSIGPYQILNIGGLHKHSDTIIVHNSNVNDEIFFPDGIYKFYILPCYCYSELSYFGCFSEPYTYYHNYTPSNSGSGNETAPDFPESYTFPAADISHPLNTGYTTAKAKLAEGSALSDGFVYGIKYRQKDTSKQYEYGGLEFVVPSGYIYDTYLYAKNANGTIFESEQQNPVVLDATYDNIPPYVDVANTWVTIRSSSPDKICLYGSAGSSYATLPSDKGSSGIYINTDGKKEFDYYLIKKANKGASITDQITRADLSNYTKHTIAYPADRTYLWLDWDSFIEGYYILVLDLKDNNQNSALYSYVVVNATTPEIPETWVDTVNKKLHVKALPSHGSYYGYINLLQNNEWSASYRYEGQAMGNAGIVNRAYGFVFADASMNYFTRCSVSNGNSSDFIHSLYAYVCTGYYMKKAADESFECSSKAVIPGLGGAYQVYYDAPCFAHTMAFPTDRLDDLDAKLIEAKSIAQKNNQTIDEAAYIKAIWETKGREYGLQILNSNWLESAATKSYVAPVNEIPSGYSYVTIFHFADGTTAMSEVKQKQ